MSPEDIEPMIVVYRLQGLDGEAKEDFVEALPDDSGEQRDPGT